MVSPRLEASIMGESALIDKETGRVIWEGGGTSTLSASVGPKINQLGLVHFKATILTAILLVAVIGALASRLRQKLESAASTTSKTNLSRPIYTSIALFLAQWTILRFPEFDLSIILLTCLLYLIEAYTCSTRRYLANALSSPEDVEDYIEQLRREMPKVEWKVRSFHHDKPLWLAPMRLLQILSRRTQEAESGSSSNAPPSLLSRKVVTSHATGSYQYKHCIDKTMAGVWKRSMATSASPAPFAKIIITKLILLPNRKAREDYLQQQSQFVIEYGQGDECAEFSTSIEVPGFKPRLLADRPVQGVSSTKLFRLHMFWIFTLLGLTVPYRIWFSTHCDEIRVRVIKETYADQSPSKTSYLPSWFPSSRTTEASTGPVDQKGDETFRSLMQSLRLYANNETLKDKQQIMEDIEAASLGESIIEHLVDETANATSPEIEGNTTSNNSSATKEK